MADKIEIRPIRASDWDQWCRLWTLYLKFYDTTLPDAVFKSSFERLLSAESHEYNGLIAEVAGKPVGLTHYLMHRTMWSVADTCYLQDLYVDPDMRGTGLGRALIEAVYDAAKDAGAADVYWHTQHFNAVARTLYDRIADLTPFIQYAKPIILDGQSDPVKPA